MNGGRSRRPGTAAGGQARASSAMASPRSWANSAPVTMYGDPLGDVDGVVGDALEVAADEGDLHGHLHDPSSRPREAEDGAEQLLLEVVHHVVHVGQSLGPHRVAVGEGVGGHLELRRGLLPHAVDDAPHLGVELVGVDAPGGLGHVAHEVADALDLVGHPHDGDEGAQVDGHGLLAGEEEVDPLLHVVGQVVHEDVVGDDLLGRRQVESEQGLGSRLDGLRRHRREADDVGLPARPAPRGRSCGSQAWAWGISRTGP